MQKQFKKKLKQILAISMALSMILCTNAFATPIDLVNSTESVATDTLNKTEGTDYFDDEDTNIWNEGEITERVDVTVQRESEFEITIPKDIVLDGETGTADYIVNAKGDIAGNQVLKVVPDDEFELNEAGGKDNITATVTQNDTEYTYQEMLDEGTDYPGSVAATLTAGEWEGSFNFNISFEDQSTHAHNLEGVGEASWQLVKMSNFTQEDNVFTSTNKDDFSIGEVIFKINIPNDATFNFDFEVSSHSSDKIMISLNDSYDYYYSGEETRTLKLELKAGENSLHVKYVKDYSTSKYNDNCKFILNKVQLLGCTICNHSHSYISNITKEATCVEKGIKTYTCECGDAYTEEIEINSNNHIAGEDKTCIKCNKYILEEFTWEEIAEISKKGLADDYFSIGDEKKLTISSYNYKVYDYYYNYAQDRDIEVSANKTANKATYTIQIIDFNHDSLSSGGKAGITFQFKELMDIEYEIGINNNKSWDVSKMRTYLNNDVYNAFPLELRNAIKEVTKKSDIGVQYDHNSLVTTKDKLFLPSFDELGFVDDWSTPGQGSKYTFYSDDTSRIKYRYGVAAKWFTRSNHPSNSTLTYAVRVDGTCTSTTYSHIEGVAPCFCV